MSEGETETTMTNHELLNKARIPLIAQVLIDGELVKQYNRSYSLHYYNNPITDHTGNILYVSTEELAELVSATKIGGDYYPKQWVYGFFWKISEDADFSKIGIAEILNYQLTDGSTIPYPRHMPIGQHLCLHPTYGYTTVEEMNLIRQSERPNAADSSLHLSSLGTTANNTAVVSQNHIKVFAQSGEKPIRMTEVTLETIEQLASFYRRLPHGHEMPALSTTMHDVKDDVNGIFDIVDTTIVPELVKIEWENNKWLTWTPEKITDILKRCIQSLTSTSNVTAIINSLKGHKLTSTSSNWSQHTTFVNYKKSVLKVLRDNSVMEEDSEQIKPATLTAREHALLANSMFDNLPTGNEMERAFKDVVKVGSTNSDGKFGTIDNFLGKMTEVFRERLQLAAGMRKYALVGLTGEKRGNENNNGNDTKRGRQPI